MELINKGIYNFKTVLCEQNLWLRIIEDSFWGVLYIDI